MRLAQAFGFSGLLAFAANCSSGSEVSALLAAQPKSSNGADVAELNQRLALPLRVDVLDLPQLLAAVAKLLPRSAGGTGITVERVANESGLSFHITLVTTNVPEDDSVRGWRHELVIAEAPGSGWQVVQANESWQCQAGRGHADFGTSPCT